MTSAKPVLVREGQIQLMNGKASLVMQYDPAQLKPEADTIAVKDSRLLQLWQCLPANRESRL